MAEVRHRHRVLCPQHHSSNKHLDLPGPCTDHRNWSTAVECHYMDIRSHMRRGYQWVHRPYLGDPLLEVENMKKRYYNHMFVIFLGPCSGVSLHGHPISHAPGLSVGPQAVPGGSSPGGL